MKSKLSADPVAAGASDKSDYYSYCATGGRVYAQRRVKSIVQVATRCILIRDGKLLVQRGKRGHLRLPGGRVTDRETAVKCLEREMLEELAMEVVVSKLLYIVESFYQNRRKLVHEIGFYFLCESGSQPVPQERHIVVEWVELDEKALTRLRPRVLTVMLPHDWRMGWRDNPRYLVSFEED